MAKIDFKRTPDGSQRIVDENLKIGKALFLPDYSGETLSIGDNPDEPGAIAYKDDGVWFYNGTIWAKIATGGDAVPTGGLATQYLKGGTLPVWATLNTTAVPEGTNKYYTDARVETIGDVRYLYLTAGVSQTITQIPNFQNGFSVDGNIISTEAIKLLSDTQNISVQSNTNNNLFTATVYDGFEVHNETAGPGGTSEYTKYGLGSIMWVNQNHSFTTFFTPTSGTLAANAGIELPNKSGVIALTSDVLSLSGGTVTGDIQQSTSPVNGNSLINKSYADNLFTGLSWKQEVRAATTANITLSGTQTIDGVSLIAGDRALVKDQTTATQNGIYLVASGSWTRTTDADSSLEIGSATVFVRLGSVNKNTQWTCTNSTDPVIGSDNITFGAISGGGTYTNGTGISLSSNVFSIDATYTATSSRTGYLSSTDWSNFNAKQSVLTFDSAPTSGSSNPVTSDGIFSGLGLKSNLISPSFTTPSLGVASATSINKVIFTAPATSSTLTIVNGKTLTVNNSITFAGTDSTTMTFPGSSATIARTDAANTFTGHQTIEGITSTGATGTGNLVFSIAPTFTGTITAAAVTLSSTLTTNGVLSQGGAINASGWNIWVPSATHIPTGNTTSTNLFAGASTVTARFFISPSITGDSLTTTESYASFLIGTTPQMGTFTSGIHALIAQQVINPIGTVTINGTASVTNTASLYINGAASATVTGNNYALWVASGISRFGGPIQSFGYTVSTLPTAVTGMRVYVTDATSPTSLSIVAGGGSTVVPVFYNGSNWIVC